jgi:hypothetical protein
MVDDGQETYKVGCVRNGQIRESSQKALLEKHSENIRVAEESVY